MQKIHKILDDFSKGIQYKLILTTQDNDSGCCPIVLFFFLPAFQLRLICLLWCWFWAAKKKMLLPKETVRKRSIIIINEFSAHNTFYSLFKWISLSCRQVLLLWGCCYYPGFFLSNWLPYFNEPVKLLAQLWKEANRYSQIGKWPQIDKEMLTFCCFLVNIYTFPFDLIPFGLLCLPKCYSRVMIADLEFLWKYFGYEMTTKGF